MKDNNSLILALPKGRVYEDLMPVLQESQFAIKDDPKKSRKMLLENLQLKYVLCDHRNLTKEKVLLMRVKS